MKNPGRALGIKGKIGGAAISENPKAVLSTIPGASSFYHTAKGLYLGNFV